MVKTLGLNTGILRPTFGAKANEKRIITFDTEDDSCGNVSIVNFFDGEYHYTFSTYHGFEWNEVYKFIYDYPHKDCIFVAHNLEYDIVNVFRHNDFACIEKMNYTGRLISASLKNCSHQFWDSFNWNPTSLAKIAKSIGREKGDYLEARDNPLENIRYCKSDCEILWEWVQGFQQKAVNDIKVPLMATIGGMSMQSWVRNYQGRIYGQASFPSMLDAYYGGRTEMYFKGPVPGPVVVADVRSMYPTQMLKAFPDTSTLVRSRIDSHEYGIGKFTIQVPDCFIPPLPMRYEKKLFFPTGRIEGSFTYEEVRNALNCGAKLIKETPGIGTNVRCYPFRQFVNEFYKLRNSGDEMDKIFYKLLLNNLYGKFAQHGDHTVLYGDKQEETELKKLVRKLGPLWVYNEAEEGVAPKSNYMWGVYITSMARVHLHKLLVDVQETANPVLYTDTDSVFWQKQNDVKPKYIMGTKLGQMDEEIFDRAEFFTLKGYVLEQDKEGGEIKRKTASKGVPTRLAHDFFTTGKASFQKPNRMREALKRELALNYWETVEKNIRTVYMKRKVNEDGTTRAWNVSELDDAIKQGKQREVA